MSLFIPRVFLNIDEERIRNTFEKLMIGEVSRIDFVLKMDKYGSQYNAVYVHFSHWYNNSAALNLQTRIREGNEAKVVYDDPWYWIVLENKGKKQVVHGRRICIDLGETEHQEQEQEEELVERMVEENTNSTNFEEFQKNINILFDTNNEFWLKFCFQKGIFTNENLLIQEKFSLTQQQNLLTPQHVRERMNEIIESMESCDISFPNRKEIEKLGRLSRECSFLREILTEYERIGDEEMDREAEELLDEMENAENYAEANYIMSEMSCYV